MYPHERSLVEQWKDRPFVIIGVNSDKDLDKVKVAMLGAGASNIAIARVCIAGGVTADTLRHERADVTRIVADSARRAALLESCIARAWYHRPGHGARGTEPAPRRPGPPASASLPQSALCGPRSTSTRSTSTRSGLGM